VVDGGHQDLGGADTLASILWNNFMKQFYETILWNNFMKQFYETILW
jgi:hypothetical protein